MGKARTERSRCTCAARQPVTLCAMRHAQLLSIDTTITELSLLKELQRINEPGACGQHGSLVAIRLPCRDDGNYEEQDEHQIDVSARNNRSKRSGKPREEG